MIEAGYLLASFPDLSFDIDSRVMEFISVEDFKESSEIILPMEQVQSVQIAIDTPSESTLDIAKQWVEYVESIQHEVAKIRWSKIKSGMFPQAKGKAVSLEATTLSLNLQQAETPLIAQMLIFRTLWDILDLLEAQYYDSIEKVIIYGWKLHIISNVVQFRKNLGQNKWGQLVNSITTKAGFSPTVISGGL